MTPPNLVCVRRQCAQHQLGRELLHAPLASPIQGALIASRAANVNVLR